MQAAGRVGAERGGLSGPFQPKPLAGSVKAQGHCCTADLLPNPRGNFVLFMENKTSLF